MIKLTRDDNIDLYILEKEEVDLLTKGDVVAFQGIMMAYTKDMDFFISQLVQTPNNKLKGERIFEILKESNKREYCKSTGYRTEEGVGKKGLQMVFPEKKEGFDA